MSTLRVYTLYIKNNTIIQIFSIKTNKKQTHQLFAAKLQTILQYFNKPVLLLILQDQSI